VIDALALFVGLLLPWIAGSAVVAALPRRDPIATEPGGLAWIVGAGYFVGAFALTLWMRVLSIVGVPFGRTSVGLPLAALAIALVTWMVWRSRGHATPWLITARDTLLARSLADWQRVAWFALLAWLLLRYALLFAEVAWQPLYPWDAWIQWATKARVFYELGRIVPFARADAWIAAGGSAYFDASPNYPLTVPLLQTWADVALGRYDDSLMNLPWWQIGVSLSLASYAALRSFGYSALAALTGAWIVVSLPLVDVHIALAGYADLPMASFYTVAMLAALRWIRSRTLADALVALILIAACPTIKTPGIAWAATIVPAVVLAIAGRFGLRIVATLFALGALALLIFARATPRILGYQLHLDFEPAWDALAQSFFLLGNWHLLWYAAIGVAILARRQILSPALAPFTVAMIAGLAFLFVVFGFTNARNWVADQTTINRAALHFAPLVALWTLAAFRAWSNDRASLVDRSRTAATPG
jgi:hypothetical protein